MPRPKRNPSKRKVKVSSQARVRKKSEHPKDTIPKAPTRTILPTNGITFKVKVRKK